LFSRVVFPAHALVFSDVLLQLPNLAAIHKTHCSPMLAPRLPNEAVAILKKSSGRSRSRVALVKLADGLGAQSASAAQYDFL
jgi:hypothetical protein